MSPANASPSVPLERVVFAQTAEGLFVKAFGAKLSAAARAKLKALGIDIDRPLLPAYPVRVYAEGVKVIVDSCYPGMPAKEAHFEIGKRLVQGLEDTLVGKALMALVRLIGPKRALLKAAQNANAQTNYSKFTVEEIGPSHMRMVAVPFEGEPEVMAGALWAAVDMAGGKSAKVVVSVGDPKEPERVAYDVTWESAN